MIEFRRAALSDAATIASVRQKAWDATYRGIYPDEMIDDYDLSRHTHREEERLRNGNYRCYLVMDNGDCVGYFAYGIIREGVWKDFTFRLHSLYILPEYQGSGLGRIIFTQVRADCLKLGMGRMYLDCHPANDNALHFYRHMGGIVTYINTGHQNPCEDECHIEFDFTKGEIHG